MIININLEIRKWESFIIYWSSTIFKVRTWSWFNILIFVFFLPHYWCSSLVSSRIVCLRISARSNISVWRSWTAESLIHYIYLVKIYFEIVYYFHTSFHSWLNKTCSVVLFYSWNFFFEKATILFCQLFTNSVLFYCCKLPYLYEFH